MSAAHYAALRFVPKELDEFFQTSFHDTSVSLTCRRCRVSWTWLLPAIGDTMPRATVNVLLDHASVHVGIGKR